jgi:translation initiation factor 2 subunit 3
MGIPGKLPDIFIKIDVNVHLLTRLLGVKQKLGSRNPESVQDIKIGETLLVNVGSTAVGGHVSSISGGKSIITFELSKLVCAEIGEKIAISRRIEESWRYFFIKKKVDWMG